VLFDSKDLIVGISARWAVGFNTGWRIKEMEDRK
jgi:hypothetical protein